MGRRSRRIESVIVKQCGKSGILGYWSSESAIRDNHAWEARPVKICSAPLARPKLKSIFILRGAGDTEHLNGTTVWRHAGRGEIRRRIHAGAGAHRRGSPALAEVRRRAAEPHWTSRPSTTARRARRGFRGRPPSAGPDQARQYRAPAHDRRSDRHRDRAQYYPHRDDSSVSRAASDPGRGQLPPTGIDRKSGVGAAIGADGAPIARRRGPRRSLGGAAPHRKGGHGRFHARDATRAGGPTKPRRGTPSVARGRNHRSRPDAAILASG